MPTKPIINNLVCPSNPKPRTTIVGGGWAGLAAAVELTLHGYPVDLFESSPNLGGRARTINVKGLALDNGQHMMLGAYKECRRLFTSMGLQEADLFDRHPLFLHVHSLASTDIAFKVKPLPNPLHIVAGLLSTKGFTLKERFHALYFCIHCRLKAFQCKPDRPVLTFLNECKQPKAIIEKLWGPLCLAALTTPIDSASTQLFLNVLKDSFLFDRADSDWLFPKVSLGELLPKHAKHFIEINGGKVLTGTAVNQIDLNHGGTGPRVTANGIASENPGLILATHPRSALRLLPNHAALVSLKEKLNRIHYAPITTLYFKVPSQVRLLAPIVGFHGTLVEWLVDRSTAGQPGIVAAIISGANRIGRLTKTELTARVKDELEQQYPEWDSIEPITTIKEKYAAFLASVDGREQRAIQPNPLPYLWLAGDYLCQDYPSTLEGAVQSGVQCAQGLLTQYQSHV